MELNQITQADLEGLQDNNAWKLFLQEISDNHAAMIGILVYPDATPNIEKVRYAQGRVSVLDENLAWLETTSQQLKELQEHLEANQPINEEDSDE